jgi:uncharacterized protein with PIN domain
MELANQLRQLGYDVLTSYETGQANQAIDDEEVLAFAHERERAVVTLNREDFISLHKQGREHSGILICKEDRDYQRQAVTIDEFLSTDNQSLKGRLIRIKKQNQKGSSTPIFVVQEYSPILKRD